MSAVTLFFLAALSTSALEDMPPSDEQASEPAEPRKVRRAAPLEEYEEEYEAPVRRRVRVRVEEREVPVPAYDRSKVNIDKVVTGVNWIAVGAVFSVGAVGSVVSSLVIGAAGNGPAALGVALAGVAQGAIGVGCALVGNGELHAGLDALGPPPR